MLASLLVLLVLLLVALLYVKCRLNVLLWYQDTYGEVEMNGMWGPTWIRAQNLAKGFTEVPEACWVQPWVEGALGGFRCTTWKGNVSEGHKWVNRRKSPGVWFWFTCSKKSGHGLGVSL